MKKIWICFLMLLLFEQSIQADYIVLAEDEIVEEDNIHRIQSVASISKVMTALVAVENGNIGDVITVDETSASQIGSSLYLQVGEQYTMMSLLYGLMLRSGNDAAYLIARHVGGSQENFVRLMNEKAKSLGMKNSQFHNPSGLDGEDGGNLSTVYDMALCMRAAMKNEIFRLLVNTKQYRAENNRVWLNKNRLLNEYEACNGGKTGYTVKSGKTLITSAYKEGLDTIVVSFREDDYYKLHKQLHETVNEKYQSVLLVKKGEYKINNMKLTIKEDIESVVFKGKKLFVEVYQEKDEIVIRYENLDKTVERREKLK